MEQLNFSDHPVFTTEFTVLTPALAEACSIALDAVFMRRTGLVFYGLARVGKTYCAKTLKDKLSKFMPRAYVTKLEVIKKDLTYTSNIAMQIGLTEGCEFTVRELAVPRFVRIVDTIAFKCAERNCNQWVLILDEFQRLRVFDLHQLADLLNMLASRGIVMTMISFAMPGVSELRDNVAKEKDSAKLISRFMSDFIEFPGCKNVKDLRLILDAFDEASEYPKYSGVPYTRGLLPLAYAYNFRLATYSKPLWESMNSVAYGAYRKNLPLEHVFMTLRYLLRYCLRNDRPSLKLEKSDFDRAVARSKLAQFTQVNGAKLA